MASNELSKRELQNRQRLSSVFINAPYGPEHQDIFLAYLVGAVALGLSPRAAIEFLNTRDSQLEHIYGLLRQCAFSFHDLSFVTLDKGVGLPRFNMPLELGMAISEQLHTTRQTSKTHLWIAFESVRFRSDMTSSDIKGYPILVHDGTSSGVLRELANHLAGPETLTFVAMERLFRRVKHSTQKHLQETGAGNIFTPEMFRRIVGTAITLKQR